MPEGNKTEKATPKKRRDERKKGNVFMSKDAVAVAGLLGTFATLWLLTGAFAEQLGAFMTLCLITVGEESRDVGSLVGEMAIQGVAVVAKTVGPVVLMAIFCSVAATFSQTRVLVTTEPL